MSHNVKVSGTEFSDIAVLKSAVEEILKEGQTTGSFVHVEGQKQDMRGYMGRTTKVDAVVRFPNEPYDLGFQREGDNLTPIFESGFHFKGFAADPGSKPIDASQKQGYHNIGRLQQRYNVIQMERNVRAQGLASRRTTDTATGQIRLEVG